MLSKLFGFNPSETTVRKEIVAGITTFLTMSYILAVNPSIFGQLDGMPMGAVFTSTAIAAIIGCLSMAFVGKLPFGPIILLSLQILVGAVVYLVLNLLIRNNSLIYLFKIAKKMLIKNEEI